MRKAGKLCHLIGIDLEVDVARTIEEQLNILDESYGTERNIDADLGGYVLVLETKDDVIEARANILKDIIVEYVDDIESEGGIPQIIDKELYEKAQEILRSRKKSKAVNKA